MPKSPISSISNQDMVNAGKKLQKPVVPTPVTPEPVKQEPNRIENIGNLAPTNRVAEFLNKSVATKANPVIDRTPVVKEEQQGVYQAPDYSVIQDMDQDQLQGYVDTIMLKQSRGEQPSDNELLSLMQAQRKLQAPKQELINPYTGAIENAEEQRDKDLERITRQATDIYRTKEQEISDRFALKQQEQERAGEDTMQAVKGALAFSGFGRSTYAAEKQAEVQETVNANLNIISQQREAEIAKAQAERDGAGAEVLASYDQYINGLQTQSQAYQNEMVLKMNEYNQQNTLNYEEKINNILQLANQFEESQVPLTKEEIAVANSYATLAIDKDGNINEKFLETVPSRMLGAVLKQASVIKGAIPEQGKEYGFTNVGGGLVAVTDPTTGEVTFKQGDVRTDSKFDTVEVGEKTYLFDENTGEYKQINASISNTGDLRGLAPQFPGQARAKNNNPAGITWNSYFDNPVPGSTAQRLIDAGVSFQKGTARPANEGGNYVTFPTIEDGLKAQRIIMEGTYGNSTVGGMLGSRVGTSEAPNYAKQVAGGAGISLNTKVSDLTDAQLEQLQLSKIQKESPGLYDLLTQEPASDLTPEKKEQFEGVVDAIKDLQSTEGFEGAVGAGFQKFVPGRLKPGKGDFVPGTKSANYEAKFDRLKNMMTLPNLEKLKGAMSDNDIKFIQSASSAISLDMSEEEFKKTLDGLLQIYTKALGKTVEQKETNTPEVKETAVPTVNIDEMQSIRDTL